MFVALIAFKTLCWQVSDGHFLKCTDNTYDESSPFNSTHYAHKMAIVVTITVDSVMSLYLKYKHLKYRHLLQ